VRSPTLLQMQLGLAVMDGMVSETRSGRYYVSQELFPFVGMQNGSEKVPIQSVESKVWKGRVRFVLQ
jgi:hypothetical protein